jgi:hypothetical protein
MKTAIQQMMTAIEKEIPRLLNTSTSDGRKFIDLVYPYFEMEQNQIEKAFQEGYTTPHGEGFPENGEQYYNETF